MRSSLQGQQSSESEQLPAHPCLREFLYPLPEGQPGASEGEAERASQPTGSSTSREENHDPTEKGSIEAKAGGSTSEGEKTTRFSKLVIIRSGDSQRLAYRRICSGEPSSNRHDRALSSCLTRSLQRRQACSSQHGEEVSPTKGPRST